MTNALEATFGRFKAHHPNFSGDVIFVGHSLGGVILFELLRLADALTFRPTAFYTLGSPVGIFLHCSGNVPGANFTLPNGTRYMNIFHPGDPVAYRVEPLFGQEFAKRPPQ